MINVKVDKADPTDLYEQVAAEIRRAIAEEAKPGERLPPAKDLAAVLGVNTNTVPSASAPPRGGAARVPARAWRLGRGDARARGGCPESQGAGRLRPTAGLPRGRVGRDHPRGELRNGRANAAQTAPTVRDGPDRPHTGRSPDSQCRSGNRRPLRFGYCSSRRASTARCCFGGWQRSRLRWFLGVRVAEPQAPTKRSRYWGRWVPRFALVPHRARRRTSDTLAASRPLEEPPGFCPREPGCARRVASRGCAT